MPYAILHMGIYLGLGSIVLMALLSHFSTMMHLKVKDLTPRRYESMYEIAYLLTGRPSIFIFCIVMMFANFFEQMASYQNAFLMWSKFLRIQQAMFGSDREQMITTYKKMAALSVAIQQPHHSLKFLELADNL